MLILFNTKAHQVPIESTLQQVLDRMGVPSRKGIAIAVNQQIVPRTTWNSYPLKENDSLTLIQATQGG